jgi:hypothetical protein
MQKESVTNLNCATDPKSRNHPFQKRHIGLETKLLQGARIKDVNVTSNHPILTGEVI